MKKGKITTVYSIVQGNGAKFICTNLAYYCKKMYPERNVALVDFDFKFPFLALSLSPNDETHGIDNVIDKIDGDFLDKELFEENMVKMKSGIHLLKGTKLQNNHSLIRKQHIEKVMELLRESYDYIFVVANSEFDNSASIYTTIESDEIIVVGQPSYPTYWNFKKVMKKMNHYSNPRTRKWFVYNRYFESKNVDLKEIIARENLQILGAIPYKEDYVDNLDLKDNYMKSVVGKMGSQKNEQNPFEVMVQRILN